MKILTAKQMQAVDQLTTELHHVPSLTLMENAGFSLYLALRDRFKNLGDLEIAIVCGKGNNGGDGSVLARQLLQRHINCDVFLLAQKDRVRGDARVNLDILYSCEHPVFEVTSQKDWAEMRNHLEVYDVIIDAVLGTGITKPVEGLYRNVVEDINQSRAFVLAVDIPSGMFSDSVEPPPCSVWADLTVTFTAPKIAHVLNQELEAFGELEVAQIGTPRELMDTPEFHLNLLVEEDVRRIYLPRPLHSHKGTYGHVAVLAGGRGKAGAAGLTSIAALRSGSGLVTAVVPDSVQDQVASYAPEIMTEGMPSSLNGLFQSLAAERALELLENKQAAAIGPGVSTEAESVQFVRKVVRDSSVPIVLDADGLNAFSDSPQDLKERKGEILVLTPHPGEFSRLTGVPTQQILRDQLEITRSFCQEHNVWLVLKTFRPLIGSPDGQLFVSPKGNPGMATAGMGDILTGVLASLVGQYASRGLLEVADITRAVSLGVYLHGWAGDLAADRVGEDSLTSGDVIDSICEAFRRISSPD